MLGRLILVDHLGRKRPQQVNETIKILGVHRV